MVVHIYIYGNEIEVWSDTGLSNFYSLHIKLKTHGCHYHYARYVCRPTNIDEFLKNVLEACRYYRMPCRVFVSTEKGLKEVSVIVLR